MKLVNRPPLSVMTNYAQPFKDTMNIALCGDSLIAGYGATDTACTLGCRIGQSTKGCIEIHSAPFRGTVSLPLLTAELSSREYRAIILCANGNDALPWGGSHEKVHDSLTRALRLCAEHTDHVIVLENFGGLGRLYPVWWLRLWCQSRSRTVEQAYGDAIQNFLAEENRIRVTRLGIEDICCQKGHQAADGIHPNDPAYRSIAALILEKIQG